ncbi:MAG: hypothetical protein ABIZ70_09020 [Gemmatimonadales bacterium]
MFLDRPVGSHDAAVAGDVTPRLAIAFMGAIPARDAVAGAFSSFG